MGKAIIILGTAHGSNVAGKRSPDGILREFRYSREICSQLKAELEGEGYDVFVDISEDVVPSPPSKELCQRVKIVNDICDAHKTDTVIYVSIHCNALGADGQWHEARGWSIYTSLGKTKADDLATCIWHSANQIFPKDHKNAIRQDNSDGDPDYESNLYVLRYTKCPSVLTENFFQDNKKDVEYLLSDEGRKAVVEVHKRGIINYLKTIPK